MRKFIAQNIGLPLNDLVKGYRVRSYYHDFSKCLDTEYADIQKARLAKFQNLLYHAYEHTAFYRRRLDSIGATPADFRSPDAIRQIPPLTRADLQENWREMISDFSAVKHLHKGSSSGSTGSPVNYFYDNSASSAGDAALYLCWSLAGWRLGMKGLHIWGNPTTVKNEWARPSSRIKAWIFNHAKFPAFQLTDPARKEELAE